MGRLVVVRHGGSAANENAAFYRCSDSAICLTTGEIEQALNTAEVLASIDPRWAKPANLALEVLASVYARTQQTARIALDHSRRPSPYGAAFDASAKGGLAELPPDPSAAADLDPERWAEESAALAKQHAYAPPIGDGPDAVMLTRDYETEARNVARSQASLAAARLANVLNGALR